jgi:hypothetical protein
MRINAKLIAGFLTIIFSFAVVIEKGELITRIEKALKYK